MRYGFGGYSLDTQRYELRRAGHSSIWHRLQAIAELPEADLHRGLAQLRAAEFLGVLYVNRSTEQVERLAHHAPLGEMWVKALTYSI